MYYAALMRNETLDSIYHPTLTLVENRMFDIMFPFSIVMFIFTLYVVAVKSTVSMRHYKHILIFEIFSSYSFDIVWFLWRPNLLWPMRAAILTGPMGNISPYSFQILYGAFLFDVSTVATSQIIQFVFRLSTTLESENIMRKVMTTKLSYMYACSLVIFGFFIVMLMSPVFLNIIDPKESQRLFIEDFPPIQKLVDEYPNLSGYHPEMTNISLELLLDAGMFLILMVPVFAFLGVMLFVHRMKLMRVLESKKTYEMHIMLLKALLAQYICVFFLILLPFGMFCFCSKFEVIWGSYLASLSMLIVSFHGPVFLNIIDPKESQRLFIEDFPPLQQLVDEHPNLSGYHPKLTNISLELLLDAGLFFILMVPVFAFLGVMLFVHRMKLMRALESKKTYEMHVMLLKALLAQYISVFFLILLPFGMFCFCSKFQVIWGSYLASLSMLIVSFHGVTNSFCILWFILPYRVYTLRLLICSRRTSTQVGPASRLTGWNRSSLRSSSSMVIYNI